MSWSIKVVGQPAAVKKKVLAEQYMPAGLKQTIAEFCDATASTGIRVESHGHHGAYGSIGKLEVENIELVQAEAPATPAVGAGG